MHVNQNQGRMQGIPNPRKNARVSRSTSGIGPKFAGTIYMKSDVFG